ncbi:MAG: head-tail connector protein [Hyphomicrobiales bacterium]|nr:head-tail connector protein [Hyphomicrobiales bacterium]
MNCFLLTGPVGEPVALAAARNWLRVDANDDDGAIAALIVAARVAVEAATRRALLTQTWRIQCNRWTTDRAGDGSLASLAVAPAPGPVALRLPVAPVQSLAGLRIYDASGGVQIVPQDIWRLAGAPEDARIVFAAPPPQPGRPDAGIEIDVVTGYGAAEDVPAPLRQAILTLVAHWYEQRGKTDPAARSMPPAIAGMLAPFARRRLP